MPTTTTNYGLTKDGVNDNYDVTKVNANSDKIDAQMKINEEAIATHSADSTILIPTGTANAITLAITLTDKNKYSFKAGANSTGSVTINGKAFKKLDGTQIGSGGIKTGKVYDFYYDLSADSVFVLAKAEGDATVGDVLAGKIFSNGDDTGLTGTLVGTGTAVIADVITGKTFYNTDLKTLLTGTNTNKNWASGTINSGTATASFDRMYTTVSTDTKNYVTVTGLTFKPSLIVVYYNGSSTYLPTIYSYSNLVYANSVYGVAEIGGSFFKNTNALSVTTTGFVLPVNTASVNYSWIAIE